jgi:hypothetical protein
MSFRSDEYPATTAQFGIALAHAIEKYGTAPPRIREMARKVLESHPSWNTPNWCDRCTPAGYGCCRCERACNE